jgi:hypothetical protein
MFIVVLYELIHNQMPDLISCLNLNLIRNLIPDLAPNLIPDLLASLIPDLIPDLFINCHRGFPSS